MSYTKPPKENRDRVLNTLCAAHDLIFPPHYWTQGAEARDGGGKEVMPLDESAVKFCLVGALRYTSHKAKNDTCLDALDALYWSLPPEYQDDGEPNRATKKAQLIAEWNDGVAEHQDVLELINKAKDLMR